MDPFVLIVQVQHLVGDLYNGGVLISKVLRLGGRILRWRERDTRLSAKPFPLAKVPGMTNIYIMFTFYVYNLTFSIH